MDRPRLAFNQYRPTVIESNHGCCDSSAPAIHQQILGWLPGPYGVSAGGMASRMCVSRLPIFILEAPGKYLRHSQDGASDAIPLPRSSGPWYRRWDLARLAL